MSKKKKTAINGENKNLIQVIIKTHNDTKGGHPHIIVDNVDNKHVSVGLSTKPKKEKIVQIISWKKVR